jgi:hypothetical protein
MTQEELRKYLDYNQETGIFTWKARDESEFYNPKQKAFNTRLAGKETGVCSSWGYKVIRFRDKLYSAHRLAWLYVYGYTPPEQIDHINNIRTDNRIINLRLASNAENCQNLKKHFKNNKSAGLLGVFKPKSAKNYYSKITANGVVIRLGKFKTKEEAHNAYVEAKRKYHEYGTL